ncbi:MAG: flagellar hook-basal body complex protein [Rhodobacteraceae bacterium]|nr:flagellar hook-basal body complex protein [Paracoccaceae bacterium]
MGSAGYAILSRQTGLMGEMQIVANNIANAATTGYRQEGLIFSEYVAGASGKSSVSMGRAQIQNTSMGQGELTQTNGDLDLAIEGDGFFMIETPSGNRLTRAGSFAPNAVGDLVNMSGYRVLDAGGAPVFVPTGVGGVEIASDGTVSAQGQPVGQIGLFQPEESTRLIREDGVMFRAEGPIGPADTAQILQGFLESSNVNPIGQVARMIEIQRAYEMGQSFLEAEDERIRNSVKSLMR